MIIVCYKRWLLTLPNHIVSSFFTIYSSVLSTLCVAMLLCSPLNRRQQFFLVFVFSFLQFSPLFSPPDSLYPALLLFLYMVLLLLILLFCCLSSFSFPCFLCLCMCGLEGLLLLFSSFAPDCVMLELLPVARHRLFHRHLSLRHHRQPAFLFQKSPQAGR